ncbi:TRAF-like superfamily protein [Actinidia rufa]|uniref:TRAF-like superfamily protein n=1 Tax=Actinidia rufa TaxID=165716 RepID=A0A7J0FYC7_9ERIC|nr:TRAF-like superfamily protein [Actinidia rufa]
MDLPPTDIEVKPEKLEEAKEAGPSFHCDLTDAEIVHKIAQAFLPGLASACVDNTTGGLFNSPESVAVDIRREMVEYLTQRSETFVAESVILEGGPEAEVSDHPYDIISDFVDDFGKRREVIAQTLLKNVDFKNIFHCDMKFNSAAELAEHSLECDFRTMNCTNEGCNARFCASHLENHASICPFEILPCEQKCSDSIMRREMDKHCITSASPGRLAEAWDVRSLTFAIKDLEAEIGPLSVNANFGKEHTESPNKKEHTESPNKKEHTESPTKIEERVKSPSKKVEFNDSPNKEDENADSSSSEEECKDSPPKKEECLELPSKKEQHKESPTRKEEYNELPSKKKKNSTTHPTKKTTMQIHRAAKKNAKIHPPKKKNARSYPLKRISARSHPKVKIAPSQRPEKKRAKNEEYTYSSTKKEMHKESSNLMAQEPEGCAIESKQVEKHPDVIKEGQI